jgi:hypothetical protein
MKPVSWGSRAGFTRRRNTFALAEEVAVGTQFIVRGVDPVSGNVTQIVVTADSTYEARQAAEASGMEDGRVLGSLAPEPVIAAGRATALL